jgi:hypothetical protein
MADRGEKKEESLFFDPWNQQQHDDALSTTIIYLTENKSAWIQIDRLPDELSKKAEESYAQMFALHPTERGKVVVKGKELVSPRWHQSYLSTPAYDPVLALHTSYMYCGKESTVQSVLPKEFQPYLDYINSDAMKHGEEKYTQVIANWQQDGNDYTPFHADCTRMMPLGADIVMINFKGPVAEEVSDNKKVVEDSRLFEIKPKRQFCHDFLYSRVSIVTRHGTVVRMCGDTQNKFRHGVPKSAASAATRSRISLTMRKIASETGRIDTHPLD